MLTDLERFIGQYRLIAPGDRIVCALSGGADSMALLWSLYLLRDKLSITLEAAHFNHGLRGEESDRDEAFVQSFCADYAIPLHLGHGSITAGKKGLEAAARDARYAFFDTIPGKIATAHTADDNAETVLMHLVRGTGLKGLGGICPQRGRIIRPMLSVTRQQVLRLLEEYHIPHREDSSNAGDRFLRNRLRHHVLPLLKQENPRLAENLSAMALRLREDEQALQQMHRGEGALRVSQLRNMPEAVCSRWLESFLKESGVREPEARHIDLARSLVFSDKPSASARFPGGVYIGRRYDELVRLEEKPACSPIKLPCPGEVTFGSYRISVQAAETAVQSAYEFTVYPRGEIIVRSRQSGDAVTTTGGTKSLKKLLIDRKIPADLRQTLPVFQDEVGILAVYGIGADRSRQDQTLRGWTVCITKIE